MFRGLQWWILLHKVMFPYLINLMVCGSEGETRTPTTSFRPNSLLGLMWFCQLNYSANLICTPYELPASYRSNHQVHLPMRSSHLWIPHMSRNRTHVVCYISNSWPAKFFNVRKETDDTCRKRNCYRSEVERVLNRLRKSEYCHHSVNDNKVHEYQCEDCYEDFDNRFHGYEIEL